MTNRPNPPASKRAREAAAKLAENLQGWCEISGNDVAAIRNGIWDDDTDDLGILVQPFIAFERTLLDEIEARVRGLKHTGGGHDEAWYDTALDDVLAAIASIQGRE